MAASITRLKPRRDRLRHEQALVLKQALLPFADGELEPFANALQAYIDQRTASTNGWTFVMLSPSQNATVVNFLARKSKRPLVAVRVWALTFEHLRDSGEITLSREEIAEAVGDTADHVSEIMGELMEFGAVSRRLERVPGMRGRGRVRYFVNPNVATHLAGAARDKAQAEAPWLVNLPHPA